MERKSQLQNLPNAHSTQRRRSANTSWWVLSPQDGEQSGDANALRVSRTFKRRVIRYIPPFSAGDVQPVTSYPSNFSFLSLHSAFFNHLSISPFHIGINNTPKENMSSHHRHIPPIVFWYATRFCKPWVK